MSKPPLMIDCPKCFKSRGIVNLYLQATKTKVLDVCDRCGGSGRVSLSMEPTRAFHKTTLQLSKRHKKDIKEWLEQERRLIYGQPEEGQTQT